MQLRFERMVEEVDDYAILLLDEAGNIERWNKGAEKIKGYTAEEVLGRNFRIFYTEEDQRNLLPERLMAEAARAGKAKIEGPRLRKNGETFWGSIQLTAIHDNAGQVIGYTKITRELTDLQQSEEKLRRSEDRYLKMVAEVQDYAILLMDLDGRVLNWNKGAEKIKGYPAEEIIGKNFRSFYTAEDRANNKPDRLLAIARQEGRAIDEGWRVRKDGSLFWGSITLTALHNDAGVVIGYSKVTRDLTEKKKAEEAELHLQKMEARNRELEQLTYITSHDLQEPLHNIRNLIEMLEEEHGSSLPEPVTEYLALIAGAAGRMSQLITGLLHYGRLGRNAEARVVNCNQVVAEACADTEAVSKAAGARITVGELPEIPAYETELRLLFQNLISNAVKFRRAGVAPVINIGAKEVQQGVWQFSVQDNGIGIEPRHRERIFMIFQRLHSQQQYEGSGIGLAHCKKIVEMHNGRIWIEAAPGHGSIFHFTVNTNSLLR